MKNYEARHVIINFTARKRQMKECGSLSPQTLSYYEDISQMTLRQFFAASTTDFSDFLTGIQIRTLKSRSSIMAAPSACIAYLCSELFQANDIPLECDILSKAEAKKLELDRKLVFKIFGKDGYTFSASRTVYCILKIKNCTVPKIIASSPVTGVEIISYSLLNTEGMRIEELCNTQKVRFEIMERLFNNNVNEKLWNLRNCNSAKEKRQYASMILEHINHYLIECKEAEKKGFL